MNMNLDFSAVKDLYNKGAPVPLSRGRYLRRVRMPAMLRRPVIFDTVTITMHIHDTGR